MMISDYLDIGQFIISLTLLGIGIWGATFALKQLRISATTDLFHRFNDPKSRKQRRWVYHNCEDLTKTDGLSHWSNKSDALETLESACNSLDWAGLLVKKGLLRKKDAIDLYGDSLIRIWVVLRPWIHITRDQRSSPKWLWNNFEWLADESLKDARFEAWKSDGVQVYTPKKVITFDYRNSSIKGLYKLHQNNDE